MRAMVVMALLGWSVLAWAQAEAPGVTLYNFNTGQQVSVGVPEALVAEEAVAFLPDDGTTRELFAALIERGYAPYEALVVIYQAFKTVEPQSGTR